MTAALEGGECSAARPSRTLPPGERPGTHCTGGWVGPRAGLNGRKISSPPGFNVDLQYWVIMAADSNLCKVSAVCCDAMNLSGYYMYQVIVLFPISVAVRPDYFTREY